MKVNVRKSSSSTPGGRSDWSSHLGNCSNIPELEQSSFSSPRRKNYLRVVSFPQIHNLSSLPILTHNSQSRSQLQQSLTNTQDLSINQKTINMPSSAKPSTPQHGGCNVMAKPNNPEHGGCVIMAKPNNPEHGGCLVMAKPQNPEHGGCTIM